MNATTGQGTPKYDFFFRSAHGWTPGSREWREEAIAAYQAAPQNNLPREQRGGTPGEWKVAGSCLVKQAVDGTWFHVILINMADDEAKDPGIAEVQNRAYRQSSREAHKPDPEQAVNARLIVAAVNACRAAMPGMSDQERITALEAGAIKQAVEALKASEKWVQMYEDKPGHDAAARSMLSVIRAALEAIGQ